MIWIVDEFRMIQSKLHTEYFGWYGVYIKALVQSAIAFLFVS